MAVAKDIVEKEMRLYALECLVCQLFAIIGKTLPPGMLEKTQKQWMAGARNKAFGADPAFSPELEDALAHLVEMQNFYLGKGAKKPPRKRRPALGDLSD
jgi:hypothetical protein